jgi:hypothetical protein
MISGKVLVNALDEVINIMNAREGWPSGRWFKEIWDAGGN